MARLAEWYHIRRVCDCAHVWPELKCALGEMKSDKTAMSKGAANVCLHAF